MELQKAGHDWASNTNMMWDAVRLSAKLSGQNLGLKKIWVISVVSGVGRGSFTEDTGPIRPFTSLSGISEGWKRGNGLLGRNLSVSQERLSLLVGCEQPHDCPGGCVLWITGHESTPLRATEEAVLLHVCIRHLYWQALRHLFLWDTIH